MARAMVENLGFGVPSFGSQAAGSRVNQGAAWIALTPRVRALMALPPQAKAILTQQLRAPQTRPALRGVRGLGQDYYDMYSDTYADSATGVPDASGYVTSLPGSVSNWGTDEYAVRDSIPVPAQQGGGQISSSVWSDITGLIKAGMQLQAQQRILDLNVERARAGLPPIDPRYFSPSAAVNFGLTPQATQMLLIGGLALGALLLLRRKK